NTPQPRGGQNYLDVYCGPFQSSGCCLTLVLPVSPAITAPAKKASKSCNLHRQSAKKAVHLSSTRAINNKYLILKRF
ncbi:MAG: hypothetical protein ACTHZH_15750, partial [Oleiphilaceae bacterium]